MSATKSCNDEEIEKFFAICDDEYESCEDEETECDVDIEHNKSLEEVHTWIVYKTTKIECFPNARYIRNATCGIKAINRYRSHTNMESDIVDHLRNVSLNLQIFQRNSANLFKPFLINVTTNLCNILDKRNFPTYTTIVMNILKRVSNVNHSCPFTKHLIVKNLYVEEKFLPIVPPLGLYKIAFHFLEGYPYDDIGTVILYIQVSDVKQFKRITIAPKV
ncbi:uncharacterized protein LOC101451812 [Ceratitis capitata]|uniref:uncharacterized protein LOC101451812 n=1 Tax=Ceratitis capitata TaxID=7213 RepID=UPI000329F058|nr:uncharacterized protein LOC101451812 [Ceratitis capitata]